jgi:AcrR family transcriptional regulator
MSPKVLQEYTDLRRKQILTAAWECFAEKGLRDTTIRDIAKSMKVSTGVIYNYFKGKDEIIEALDHWSMRNKESMFQQLARQDSPRESLRELFRLSFERCPEENFKQSMRADINVWADALKSSGLKKKFNVQYEYLREKIAGFVRSGIEKGEIVAKVQPDFFSELVIAVLIGMQVQAALLDDFSIDTNYRHIKGLFFCNLWK